MINDDYLEKVWDLYDIGRSGDIWSKRTKRVLRKTLTKYGYYANSLCINGKKKNMFNHRLVALKYVSNRLNKPHINHKDGNKLNNHYKNLEWVTPKENNKHAWKMGLAKNKGAKHKNAKLTEKQALFILENKNISTTVMAEKYKVSKSLIERIRARLTWKHLKEESK